MADQQHLAVLQQGVAAWEPTSDRRASDMQI